jgi:thymidine phosphorylase
MAADEAEALDKVERVISNGNALEYFARFIEAQGGDKRVCDDPSLLPQSKFSLSIKTDKTGWIKSINSQGIGYALLQIGAGRKKIDSSLDYSAGAYLTPKVGDYLETGVEIGKVYCNDHDQGLLTVKKILSAYEIITEKPADLDSAKKSIVLDTEL